MKITDNDICRRGIFGAGVEITQRSRDQLTEEKLTEFVFTAAITCVLRLNVISLL
jgi:hypothetical protein